MKFYYYTWFITIIKTDFPHSSNMSRISNARAICFYSNQTIFRKREISLLETDCPVKVDHRDNFAEDNCSSSCDSRFCIQVDNKIFDVFVFPERKI